MRKIGIVGTGYIGLVTGLGLADFGNKVTCFDVDYEKIEKLKNGISPIKEKNIDELLKRNIENKRITFTTNIQELLENSEIIFVCVNTPPKEDGNVDLSQIISVSENLAQNIKDKKIIAIKSTVPIGTLEKITLIFEKYSKRKDKDFELAVVPEFLREGNAVYDFFNPSRIVIGAENPETIEKLKEVFLPLNAPIVVTSPNAAILIKYASNAFLAMRISFINEIANIAEKFGIDIKEVIEGMKYDKRIGKDYLQPGIGFGGPCLGKDLMGLIKMAEKEGYHPSLLISIFEKNEHQIRQIIYKIKFFLGEFLDNQTIGILGLTFKPDTNDVRNSLALRIIKMLKNDGAKIKAYDPLGIDEAKKEIQDIEYYDNPYDVAKDSNCLVILTGWKEFKELDFRKIKDVMKTPIIIDGVNLLDPKTIKEMGFIYKGVGRQ
ncbi:MAG: nucleotide sugar dehydrogenase [Dictyoglomus thermophilum]|nr:nucleotide sugar dehydrogenase [Dictyoglomus thermophilum]MCX7720296.1 nucleotide sugar dehydrogenase [Dictyoglomus thermophilum]